MANTLVIIIVSLILSAFFSGMEIAFLTSNKLKIELDKKRNAFTSKVISIFTRNPGQYITTMLIGNNIVLVVFGIFMSDLLYPILSQYFHHNSWILVAKTFISTIIILIIGDFLPKVIFRINPNFLFNFFLLPLLFFYLLFYPIALFTTSLSNFFIRKVFKVRNLHSNNEYIFGRVDLDAYLNLGENSKREENEEQEIKFVRNALDFSETKVKECMKPRKEIEAIDVTSTVEELRNKFIETGFSKILVYRQTIDHIIGYVSLKDLFNKPSTIRSKLIKCIFVPESMSAYKLLNTLLAEKKSIAVVVDEFGGTSGIVTIEDIIEEIFGEIEDEHDDDRLTEKQISENEYIFSGRHEIDYLNEKYHFNIPDNDEYDTLAGFILYHYQSLPNKNDTITINKFEFTILRVTETRLDLISMKIID